MTELTTTNAAAYINTIRSTESVEELTQMIKQIDALKVALDSANAFRENAIKYAILEAEALLRVVELGGIKKLRAPHKDTAEWLASMSEAERDKYIKMCGEGLTIDQVYKREYGDDLKMRIKLADLNGEREAVIWRVSECGYVDLHDYCQRVRSKAPDYKMANDIIDGTRNALRKAGAVGIGHKSLTYVMPTVDNKEDVYEAVFMRIKSAILDLENVKEIAAAAQIKIVLADFLAWINEDLESCKTSDYEFCRANVPDYELILSDKRLTTVFEYFEED